MRLSENTITILKNFASLNTGIVIKPGSLLVTRGGRDILARAHVPDVFPRQIAIGNLSKLLGVVNYMQEPEFEFGENQLTIRSGQQVVNMTYAAPEAIATPKADDVNAPISITFPITAAEFMNVTKVTTSLGLPHVAIVGDGSSITIRGINAKDRSADSFSITVAESDKTFRYVFEAARWAKFLEKDFTIGISKQGLVRLTHDDVTYIIAVDPTNSDAGNL